MTDKLAALLAEAKRLDAIATPGPWICSHRGDGSASVYTAEDGIDGLALIDDGRCPYIRGEVRAEDGEFAVGARTLLPQLVAAVEALSKLVAVSCRWSRTDGGADCGECLSCVQRNRIARAIDSLVRRESK